MTHVYKHRHTSGKKMKTVQVKGGGECEGGLPYKIFIASSFKSIQLYRGSQASTVRNWAGPVVITSLLISTDGLFAMGSAWLVHQNTLPFPISPAHLHVLSPPSHDGTYLNSSGYWTVDIHHPRIHLQGIFILKVSLFSLTLYLTLPLLFPCLRWHSLHGKPESSILCHDQSLMLACPNFSSYFTRSFALCSLFFPHYLLYIKWLHRMLPYFISCGGFLAASASSVLSGHSLQAKNTGLLLPPTHISPHFPCGDLC